MSEMEKRFPGWRLFYCAFCDANVDGFLTMLCNMFQSRNILFPARNLDLPRFENQNLFKVNIITFFIHSWITAGVCLLWGISKDGWVSASRVFIELENWIIFQYNRSHVVWERVISLQILSLLVGKSINVVMQKIRNSTAFLPNHYSFSR